MGEGSEKYQKSAKVLFEWPLMFELSELFAQLWIVKRWTLLLRHSELTNVKLGTEIVAF